MIGAHGIVGSIGGALLTLGFVKLLCGGVIFCRKSKAQEFYDKQKERGVDVKGGYSKTIKGTITLHVMVVSAITRNFCNT